MKQIRPGVIALADQQQRAVSLQEVVADLRARGEQLDPEELDSLIEEARAEFYTVQQEASMKRMDYMAVADRAMEQIKAGAFLTVKAGEAVNTMTIGWATIGYVWQQPIMMVAVRLSRHTFSLMEAAADFTVSIPAAGMETELEFCGNRSGREVDKFEASGLRTAPAQKVTSPIIQATGLHYECKIVYKSAMDPAHLSPAYDKALYPRKDYHTLYFGEIVDCYEIE
jgi:flavin reductase (DIM6/NTAB) family NADH-FMN oxidoreductase RutF